MKTSNRYSILTRCLIIQQMLGPFVVKLINVSLFPMFKYYLQFEWLASFFVTWCRYKFGFERKNAKKVFPSTVTFLIFELGIYFIPELFSFPDLFRKKHLGSWEGDTKLSQIPKFSSASAGIFPLPVSSPCATPRRPRHFEYHFHPPTFHHGDLGLQRTRRGRHCSAEFPSFAFTTLTQRLFSRNHLLLTLAITPERLA